MIGPIENYDKYYVKSGEFEILLLSDSPDFAVLESVELHLSNHNTDANWIWVDDRGFRESTARWRYNLNTLICELSGEIGGEMDGEWSEEGDMYGDDYGENLD